MASEACWFREPSPMPRLRELQGSRLKRLQEEVEEVSEQLKAKKEEQERREGAVERLRRAVRELWPAATLQVFGSQATGFNLKGLSDIDVMVMNGAGVGRLWELAAHLRRRDMCAGLPQLKARARVPILRFREALSGVEMDVSLQNVQQGRLQAQKVEWMKSMAAEFPSLRPLYMVLKLFLHQRQLNLVYEKGGLNSYTLFVMLVAYLQMEGREAVINSSSSRSMVVVSDLAGKLSNLKISSRAEAENLGALLAGFLHFYGSRLEMREYGVSCRNGGCCFRKVEREGFYNAGRPHLLAVEDPLLPSYDLAWVSFGFLSIRHSFFQAYSSLLSSLSRSAAADPSILSCIIHSFT